MKITDSVWFITGASAGLGRLLAERLLERGARVVATARKVTALESLPASDNLLTLPLDVTHQNQVTSALEAAIARFGRIDVLVNNAGYGVIGAVEEVQDSEIRALFDTNVFGLLTVTRAVLPHMRAARSGHILNISSVAGLVGSPGWGIYQASKHAVEGLSEAMSYEVAPLGIKTTIVEPGPFRTEFLAAGRSAVLSRTVIPEYDATAGGSRRYVSDKHGKQSGDPEKAVAAMIAVVESESPPLRLPLGSSAVDRIRKKLAEVERDLSAGEQTARNADFPE